MKQEDFNKLSVEDVCLLVSRHPNILRADILASKEEPKLIKSIFTSHDVDAYLEKEIKETEDDYYLN